MRQITIFVTDLLIILGFALLPGIRGYPNWAIHEYLGIGAILGYILYTRHKNIARHKQVS